MLEVDISNIWGEISLPDLLGMEKAVFDAHRMVAAAPEDYGLTGERLEQDFSLYSFENPAWLIPLPGSCFSGWDGQRSGWNSAEMPGRPWPGAVNSCLWNRAGRDTSSHCSAEVLTLRKLRTGRRSWPGMGHR